MTGTFFVDWFSCQRSLTFPTRAESGWWLHICPMLFQQESLSFFMPQWSLGPVTGVWDTGHSHVEAFGVSFCWNQSNAKSQVPWIHTDFICNCEICPLQGNVAWNTQSYIMKQAIADCEKQIFPIVMEQAISGAVFLIYHSKHFLYNKYTTYFIAHNNPCYACDMISIYFGIVFVVSEQFHYPFQHFRGIQSNLT